ncbi:MAG: hypothetical protein Q7T92_03845 [Lutibacter sp.]|nr:hypothetical protein [Lutibacter sp.]
MKNEKFINVLRIDFNADGFNHLVSKNRFNKSLGICGAHFFYSLIYRTYIDGKRLADKNILQKKDSWKMMIPGSHIKYFKELYLK